jgi:hypothetical protein
MICPYARTSTDGQSVNAQVRQLNCVAVSIAGKRVDFRSLSNVWSYQPTPRGLSHQHQQARHHRRNNSVRLSTISPLHRIARFP